MEVKMERASAVIAFVVFLLVFFTPQGSSSSDHGNINIQNIEMLTYEHISSFDDFLYEIHSMNIESKNSIFCVFLIGVVSSQKAIFVELISLLKIPCFDRYDDMNCYASHIIDEVIPILEKSMNFNSALLYALSSKTASHFFDNNSEIIKIANRLQPLMGTESKTLFNEYNTVFKSIKVFCSK
jgi:hypothetical protein